MAERRRRVEMVSLLPDDPSDPSGLEEFGPLLDAWVTGRLERILEHNGDKAVTAALLEHLAAVMGWTAGALGEDRARAMLKIVADGLKRTAPAEGGTRARRRH